MSMWKIIFKLSRSFYSHKNKAQWSSKFSLIQAPGQIIKPTPQNSRRGRPKAREVYDSESDTEDIASNSLDRLCDFVVSV